MNHQLKIFLDEQFFILRDIELMIFSCQSKNWIQFNRDISIDRKIEIINHIKSIYPDIKIIWNRCNVYIELKIPTIDTRIRK